MRVLERALVEPVRAVVTVPPQHGKSETALHWIPWVLLQHPTDTIAYVTYATEFARSQSRKARRYAMASGLELDRTANRLEEWLTPQGGGVFATGAGGPLTGRPVKRLLADDLFKNREEAESRAIREARWEWFTDVALTRLHPDSSAVLINTRWHVDDIAGRLLDQDWEQVHLPAISDRGEALWPEQRPIEFLRQQEEQLGAYSFASLYQGRPRPRGGALFSAPAFYERETASPSEYRTAIGIDLAYTAKTHADYSVAVVLGEDRREAQPKYYILELIRKQVTASEFALVLKSLAGRYPGPQYWYCSTTERGSADILRMQGIPVKDELATADKFVRAQPVAAAWNAGKILVPRETPWTHALIDEVTNFTGVNDPHDDIVDALAAAFDALAHMPSFEVEGYGARRSAGLRWAR